MKTLKNLILMLAFSGIFISCNAQTDRQENTTNVAETDKVEVYYFHFNKRCVTCNAIESVSQEAIKEYYGEKVSFAGFNLDKPTGKEKGEQLEVSGQTLLIVSGKTKINITNEGFLNARSNPDKLKQIIKENIDPLL